MRLGCRMFESCSGHLIFSSICSVYIDRHIRVDLSDDEHYAICSSVLNFHCHPIYINLLILVDVITLSDEEENIGEANFIALTGQ